MTFESNLQKETVMNKITLTTLLGKCKQSLLQKLECQKRFFKIEKKNPAKLSVTCLNKTSRGSKY